MKDLLNTKNKKIAATVVALIIVIGCIYLATSAARASDENHGIGLEKSMAAALADAGLARDKVQNLKGHFDEDDGIEVYDVYFEADGLEYEYTVEAASGKILESEIETPDGDTVTPQQTQGIGTDKAKAAALKHAGLTDKEVTFTKSKQDTENGRLVYEFEFMKDSTEYEYDVDASTGKIIAYSQEKKGAAANNSSVENTAGSHQEPSTDIGEKKAKSIALKHAGLKDSAVTFTEAKLDRDGNVYHYELEFHDNDSRIEYDYKIDAASGDILGYGVAQEGIDTLDHQ